jgi:hypothetical protein
MNFQKKLMGKSWYWAISSVAAGDVKAIAGGNALLVTMSRP